MTSAYSRLRTHLKRAAGIVLDADKQYVAEARLAPLVQGLGHNSLDALVRRIETDNQPGLTQSVIDAMTVNETYFFRDRAPFDLLSQFILPQLMSSRNKSRVIRIWCAGCSTGQEPYSIAMILDECARQLAGWRIELLATDISRRAIDAGRAASYNQFEVQRGLPVNMLLRYLQRSGDKWRVAEHLVARVNFQVANLISDFSHLGKFDVIFCRNVLLYFDPDTKMDVLNRMSRATLDGGFLILGATESATGGSWRPHSVHPALNVRAQAESSETPRLSLVSKA